MKVKVLDFEIDIYDIFKGADNEVEYEILKRKFQQIFKDPKQRDSLRKFMEMNIINRCVKYFLTNPNVDETETKGMIILANILNTILNDFCRDQTTSNNNIQNIKRGV